ncbi:4081_t:CDS:2, partial [Racocetra persica]
FEEIDDNYKAFNHCMDDIILKLSNVETMVDANEAMRSIKSVKDLFCVTEAESPELASENDYFDYLYGIVSTATEWHFIIYTPDGVYATSNSEYQINLSKTAIKENPNMLQIN